MFLAEYGEESIMFIFVPVQYTTKEECTSLVSQWAQEKPFSHLYRGTNTDIPRQAYQRAHTHAHKPTHYHDSSDVCTKNDAANPDP